MEAELIRTTILSCQVCVPQDWNDAQVIAFAEKSNPCGTTNGWFISREGDEYLMGTHERVNCADRVGFIHVVLYA
jgi:hypothetical protein